MAISDTIAALILRLAIALLNINCDGSIVRDRYIP
jgi:hypothetical protein